MRFTSSKSMLTLPKKPSNKLFSSSQKNLQPKMITFSVFKKPTQKLIILSAQHSIKSSLFSTLLLTVLLMRLQSEIKKAEPSRKSKFGPFYSTAHWESLTFKEQKAFNTQPSD